MALTATLRVENVKTTVYAIKELVIVIMGVRIIGRGTSVMVGLT